MSGASGDPAYVLSGGRQPADGAGGGAVPGGVRYGLSLIGADDVHDPACPRRHPRPVDRRWRDGQVSSLAARPSIVVMSARTFLFIEQGRPSSQLLTVWRRAVRMRSSARTTGITRSPRRTGPPACSRAPAPPRAAGRPSCRTCAPARSRSARARPGLGR